MMEWANNYVLPPLYSVDGDGGGDGVEFISDFLVGESSRVVVGTVGLFVALPFKIFHMNAQMWLQCG